MDNNHLNSFLFYALGIGIFAERAQVGKQCLDELIGNSPFQGHSALIKSSLDALMNEKTPGNVERSELLEIAERVLRILAWNPGRKDNENDLLPSMLSRLKIGEEARESKESYWTKLERLSPESIFPISKEEQWNIPEGYQKLWKDFIGATPEKGKFGNNSFQWLESLDKRMMEFFCCQPPAGEKANYSLYDQIKTAAALAACLSERQTQENENPFFLIKADFWGIQEFIFSGNTHTNKAAAKVLRGRSLMVSLITECAALRILKDLNLPPACLLINAAGQNLILAPNTEENKEQLKEIKKSFYEWSFKKTLGKSGVLLSWVEIGETDISDFSAGLRKINRKLERDKFAKFDLLSKSNDWEEHFNRYFDTFEKNSPNDSESTAPNELLCPVNSDLAGQIGRKKGLYPLGEDKDDESNSELRNLSYLSFDQVLAGQSITSDRRNFIAFSDYVADEHLNTRKFNSTPYKNEGRLINDYFGFQIRFFKESELDKFKNGDFGLLVKLHEPGQDGNTDWVPTRFLKGSIPRYKDGDAERFEKTDSKDRENKVPEPRKGVIKALPHIAEENIRKAGANGEAAKGIRCLIATKGDVDNLGQIFQTNTQNSNPAAYLCLSRSMDLFFSYYLPSLGNPTDCKEEENFPNTYTVFAGGDDFFLIGPQREQMALAEKMRKEFNRYAGRNEGITFSAGLFMASPFPNIYVLAKSAERFLEEAKKYQHPNSAIKNAVNIYGISMGWGEYENLNKIQKELGNQVSQFNLSQGFLYKILELTEMAAAEKKKNGGIRNSLWYSQLAYTVARMNFNSNETDPKALKKKAEESRKKIHEFFLEKIRQHREKFKIPVFNHLYENRIHQPKTENGEADERTFEKS